MFAIRKVPKMRMWKMRLCVYIAKKIPASDYLLRSHLSMIIDTKQSLTSCVKYFLKIFLRTMKCNNIITDKYYIHSVL